MATGIKQLHSTPGNPVTLGPSTDTQGTARMIRPSNVRYSGQRRKKALNRLCQQWHQSSDRITVLPDRSGFNGLADRHRSLAIQHPGGSLDPMRHGPRLIPIESMASGRKCREVLGIGEDKALHQLHTNIGVAPGQGIECWPQAFSIGRREWHEAKTSERFRDHHRACVEGKHRIDR